MYTQCPDCGTSFRVTAEALKQAAGKVRCGGCGQAFNALAYLSESKPDKITRIEVDESLPELIPEPNDEELDTPPEAISPEQSAALLKTLDELAGEDIRLKDTGVEWRVLSDDEDSDDDEPKVDQLLESSPTEVDELLTETPNEVEAGEIFKDPASSDVDAAEVFEAADQPANQSRAEELRFDDDTGLPEDFDFSGEPAPVPDEEPEPESEEESEPDEAQVDLALGDPDEWGELLDEVVDDSPVAESSQPEDADSPTDVSAANEDDAADKGGNEESMLDIDTQFGMQAEAMGIDISGVHEQVDEETPQPDLETSIDEDLIAAAFETEQAIPDVAEDADKSKDGEPFKDTENLEVRLEDVLETVSAKSDASDGAAAPTSAEEKKTLDMQIDEELLSVAVEDQDGFASTIVMDSAELQEKGLQAADDVNVPEDTVVLDEIGDAHEDTVVIDDISSDPEEIIMSGKFARSAEEAEQISILKRKEDSPLDPDLATPEETPKYEAPRATPNSRMFIAAAVLTLLLTGQIIHQSRTALATVPGLGAAIAPVYRAFGAPISPEWDVTGWRFEVSKGSTNPTGGDSTAGDEETLTIYSRIGNQSDSPLPYPLISVALTDRFEEIIGSKVLEPNEYLSGEFDPRVSVQTGDTFNAVISIDTPAPEATGFKLNVCYRRSGGLLRCAIDDFK